MNLQYRPPPVKVTADELTYNALSFDQFVVERTAAYISQIDTHFGVRLCLYAYCPAPCCNLTRLAPFSQCCTCTAALHGLWRFHVGRLAGPC